MNKLIKKNLIAKTIFIKIHYSRLSKKIVSQTGDKILSIRDLYQRVRKLFLKAYNGEKVRLLGIGVSNIESANTQNDLFALDKDLKLNRMEQTIVKLNDKSIIPARLLKSHDD